MISKLLHEVMLFITSPLSNKDIYSCLNVSREWRKTFEYFRWPHMIVKLSKLNSLKEDEKRHWIYNGYRSQYLQFYYENNSGDQFNDMDFHLKNIQDAQKYFPNIETLRFYFDAEFFPLPILANHGQAWSSLTSVSLVSFGEAGKYYYGLTKQAVLTITADLFIGTYTYKDLDYLIDSLPNITAFEMTGTTIDPSSLYSVKSVHTSTNLKTLTIKCNDIPYLFYLYCKKRFPALCSITFDKIGPSSLLALPLSTSDDGFPEILTAETLNCFKDVNVRLANIGVGRSSLVKFLYALGDKLKTLFMTVSVNLREYVYMALMIFIPITSLRATLETLHLNLSTSRKSNSFIFDMPASPCLRDLDILYLEGYIKLDNILLHAPALKRAKFEVNRLEFKRPLIALHGLESLELVGLLVSRNCLENISLSCKNLQPIKMLATQCT